MFVALRRPLLEWSGAPAPMIDQLVAMQFRSQAESYRTRYPNARRLVIEGGDEPIGRLIVEAEAADLYIVDIDLRPDVHGRGFGGAAVAHVQRDAAAAGLGVRALVLPDNGPSLAMFRRRGLKPTGRSSGHSLELRWVAGGGHSR